MKELRFATIGAGFWARYQLHAWKELDGVRCVALCDSVPAKAETLARDLGIPATYTDAETMLRAEQPDFVEVITDAPSHAQFVKLAAALHIPVICQKPMAASLPEAIEMVRVCQEAGVPFFVHENFRWQAPMLALKRVLDDGAIGAPFRARFDFVCSFPVFENQPGLRDAERFILADVGIHLFDIARFYFGEAASLFCRTHRVHPDIRGEDVATVVLTMNDSGATVVLNLSFASRTESERFPETFAFIEGSLGSIELGPDFSLRVTTAAGTHSRRVPPVYYPWLDPRYAVVQSSIVECNRNMLDALRAGKPADTHASDNLLTTRLLAAAYDSAAENRVILIQS